jgi:hypothetical protein
MVAPAVTDSGLLGSLGHVKAMLLQKTVMWSGVQVPAPTQLAVTDVALSESSWGEDSSVQFRVHYHHHEA